jgi:spore photoproduct lyase
MAEAGYPVGRTVAPIIAAEGCQQPYGALIDDGAAALFGVPGLDLAVELITHRFNRLQRRAR